MKVVLSAGGQHWLYEPDNPAALGMIRAKEAESIYTFQQEAKQNPPERYQQLQESGAAQADVDALTWLLTECDEQGVPKEWNRQMPARCLEFLSILPVTKENGKTLREIKADFFERADLLNVGSLQQLSLVFAASMNGGALGKRLLQAAINEIANESSAFSDSSDSTSQESLSDDSVPEATNAPSSGGDSGSSSEDSPGKSTV